MTVVNSDLLSSTLTGARAIFRESFDAAIEQAPWRSLVMEYDSSGHESLQYGWFGSVPKMEEFKGSLELGGLERQNFTLTNVLYKGGFAVQRQAFERDQLQEIPPRTAQLADEAARRPGEALFDLIEANSTTTFDSTAFFANTRTIGSSANIDNNLAITGTSAANVRTDIGLARTAMMNFQDDKGRPINRAPNVFLIAPSLSAAFYEALNVGAGSDDVGVTPAGVDGLATWNARGYTVIECAYLTADTWYALHVARGNAPFVYQVEVPPMLESITNPESESGLIHERFIYSARSSFQVGFADPRYAIKVA